MTQSPNDQNNMHKILKMLVRSYRYMTIYTDPLGGSWVGLKELLKRLLDSASFKMSIWKFLCHYEDFTDKAFVGTTVKSAFEKAHVDKASHLLPLNDMNTSRQRAAAIDDSLLLHHEGVKISKEAKKRKATEVGNESSTIRNPRVLPVKNVTC